MPVEENIQLIRRWFQEIWNEGRIQTVHDLLAPNAVGRGQTGSQAEIHGPKDFVPFVNQIRAAFPDIHVEIEDAFGVGDKVVALVSNHDAPRRWVGLGGYREISANQRYDHCQDSRWADY